MSAWDLATWATVVVLGPGAVVVFAAFLRDARRMLREHRRRAERGGWEDGRDRQAAPDGSR